MPPVAKISKQDILETAFEILKKENAAAITARRLAKELNCSTHPIYQCFENMDDLYRELRTIASRYYRQLVEENADKAESPWLALGISYVQMAYRQKSIYRFLYVEQVKAISNIDEYFGKPNSVEFRTEIANDEDWRNRSEEEKAELHLMVKIFCRGLSSIANSCEKELDKDQIRRLLQRCYHLF